MKLTFYRFDESIGHGMWTPHSPLLPPEIYIRLLRPQQPRKPNWLQCWLRRRRINRLKFKP
jgi:hypothetical protein